MKIIDQLIYRYFAYWKRYYNSAVKSREEEKNKSNGRGRPKKYDTYYDEENLFGTKSSVFGFIFSKIKSLSDFSS